MNMCWMSGKILVLLGVILLIAGESTSGGEANASILVPDPTYVPKVGDRAVLYSLDTETIPFDLWCATTSQGCRDYITSLFRDDDADTDENDAATAETASKPGADETIVQVAPKTEVRLVARETIDLPGPKDGSPLKCTYFAVQVLAGPFQGKTLYTLDFHITRLVKPTQAPRSSDEASSPEARLSAPPLRPIELDEPASVSPVTPEPLKSTKRPGPPPSEFVPADPLPLPEPQITTSAQEKDSLPEPVSIPATAPAPIELETAEGSSIEKPELPAPAPISAPASIQLEIEAPAPATAAAVPAASTPVASPAAELPPQGPSKPEAGVKVESIPDVIVSAPAEPLRVEEPEPLATSPAAPKPINLEVEAPEPLAAPAQAPPAPLPLPAPATTAESDLVPGVIVSTPAEPEPAPGVIVSTPAEPVEVVPTMPAPEAPVSSASDWPSPSRGTAPRLAMPEEGGPTPASAPAAEPLPTAKVEAPMERSVEPIPAEVPLESQVRSPEPPRAASITSPPAALPEPRFAPPSIQGSSRAEPASAPVVSRPKPVVPPSSSLNPNSSSSSARAGAALGRPERPKVARSFISGPATPASASDMLSVARQREAAGPSWDAVLAYRLLERTHPGSSEARVAAVRLKEITEALEVKAQEVRAAQVMKRAQDLETAGNRALALGYFQQIVKTYPKTPTAQQALERIKQMGTQPHGQ